VDEKDIWNHECFAISEFHYLYPQLLRLLAPASSGMSTLRREWARSASKTSSTPLPLRLEQIESIKGERYQNTMFTSQISGSSMVVLQRLLWCPL
jgi:hypothetical protein